MAVVPAEEIERCADPPAAGAVVDRVAVGEAAERLSADPALRERLITVAAASPWLGRICATDPYALDVLADLGQPVRLDSLAGSSVEGTGSGWAEQADRYHGTNGRAGGREGAGWQAVEDVGVLLARWKNLELLRIAARDLTGVDSLEAVGYGLARLASGVLEAACRWSGADGIAVIGLGKLGGSELNYASDIDICLVGDPSRLGSMLDLARSAWRVDLDLRPEGRAGPLARSLASYQVYWDRWAQTWEFQALIKARAVAGDMELGHRFCEEAAARVWGRPFGAEELREVRAMKARTETEVARRGLATRELKRGWGGIRDIEFAIQLLQLVHGRTDKALRRRSTLGALSALSAGGYVAGADASALAESYKFLRTVEHRLQLQEGQPVHAVPRAPAARTRLARVCGYRDLPEASALAQFEEALRRHQAVARSIHERLFFRPLLEAFSSAPGSAPLASAHSPGAVAQNRGRGGAPTQPHGRAGRADRTLEPAAGRTLEPAAGRTLEPAADRTLEPGAAAARLAAFGFNQARTHQAVQELTRGFSRSSRLMQQVLPLLLEWLSESPDPDLGLLGLRTLAGGAHQRAQLDSVFRESPEATRQLCLLLGTGPSFARDLQRHPDLLAGLITGTTLARRSRDDLEKALAASLAWRTGEEALTRGLQQFIRTERLRIAARDVLHFAEPGATGRDLSDLAESVLSTALCAIAPPMPFAVIAMGKLGGRELGYASDLDVLLVHAGKDPSAAEATAERLTRLVKGATPATRLYDLDPGLRPEGRRGPLVRSLDAYVAYYKRWAEPWERQAMLRARFCAGDPELGERFAEVAEAFVWDPPFGAHELREIRRVKARVERERIPPGEDPEFHLKLGRGSLSDVEWTAQLLQLQHRVKEQGTVAAIEKLQKAGALDPEDAEALVSSYRFCESARNRLYLVRGTKSDSLPPAGPVLTALARSLGTTTADLRNEYRRHTRRAREVVERLFYGHRG